MAKIVINMPDYMLNQIMIGYPFKLPSQFVTETYKIIRNGKILPKGHGDLKDISKIDYQSGCFISSEGEPIPIIHKIATIEMIRDWLPTIIEGDKEEA